jgi:hypothetical protein
MAGQVPPGSNPAAAAAALAQQQVQGIFNNPMIPRFYGNTFGIAQTSADLSVIVVANSAPVGILTMSYSSGKSLIAELEKAIRNFETATGQAVLTNQELDAKMRPVMESGNVKV